MDDVDPAALVRRFWEEVWGQGRLELLPILFTDPYTRHSKRGEQVRSLEEFGADIVQYRRVLGNLRARFHDQGVTGDRVWSRLTVTGFDDDTGETHTFGWIQLHRVEDGRLAESWELYEHGLDWEA